MNRIFALALGALLTFATAASAFTYQVPANGFTVLSREFPNVGILSFVATGESGDTYSTGGETLAPTGFTLNELIACSVSGAMFSTVSEDDVTLYDAFDTTNEAFLELDNSTSLDGTVFTCTGIATRD